MKRSKSGKVIHRDDCPRAGAAVHWAWADDMHESEVFVRMLAYPWLRLCQSCFDGAAGELAARAAAANAGSAT